jgi:hypothetical protein
MAISDLDLLIKQYKSIGDDVPADFVDNKVQILACAVLPEKKSPRSYLKSRLLLVSVITLSYVLKMMLYSARF